MVDHTDAMTAEVERSLEEMGLVQDGDLVVIAAASPPGKASTRNSLEVCEVGDLADSTRGGEVASNKKKLGPWPGKKRKKSTVQCGITKAIVGEPWMPRWPLKTGRASAVQECFSCR